MNSNKSTDELIAEIEQIFEEGKRALLILHHKKMELINRFKEAGDAREAEEILQKIKSLQ